jgi:hypothetical protein
MQELTAQKLHGVSLTTPKLLKSRSLEKRHGDHVMAASHPDCAKARSGACWWSLAEENRQMQSIEDLAESMRDAMEFKVCRRHWPIGSCAT